jgi:hypothetical protein
VPLLVFDAALGAILIVAVILLGSRQQKRKPGHLRVLGWVLVCIPLPVAVLLHVLRAVQQATDQTLFIAGVVSFAFGAALLLGSKDDEDEDWRHSSDDSPPWWPEFEREFRAYSRVRPHDRSLTRV